MEEKMYNKYQITGDMEKKLNSLPDLCGVKIMMESAESINAGMYTTHALVKLEKLAGYDGKHIESMMEKEFSESLSRIGNEVSRISKIALENIMERTMDSILKEAFGECQNSEKDS